MSVSRIVSVTLLGVGLTGAGAAAQTAREPVAVRLRHAEERLIEFRRDLHRHPEVSGAEERTAGIVAGRLRALGLEVRTGVGGHGVVGILRGGKPGPMVAFRADMDAVPSTAPDPVEFRSTIPGVRHICGHDIHTTIGIAIAEMLAPIRRTLRGSVMLVFQPAEEAAAGAKAMLADGVFSEGKPDAIFAVHTAPLEVGTVGTAPGVMMASRDQVRISLSGAGDRGSAARTLRGKLAALGTVPASKAIEPAPEGFVMVDPGPAGPSMVSAVLSLASSTARDRARAAIERAVSELAVPGVEARLDYEEKWIAGIDNDPELMVAASRAITAELGRGTVEPVTTIVPAFSEDFGSFQQEVPGVMYFLGVANRARGLRGMPHSPDYVADEGAILIGARAMIAAILDRLSATA